MDLPPPVTASYQRFDPTWGVPVRTSVASEVVARRARPVHRLTPYGLRDITEPRRSPAATSTSRPRRTRSPGAAVPGAERHHGDRPLVFLCSRK